MRPFFLVPCLLTFLACKTTGSNNAGNNNVPDIQVDITKFQNKDPFPYDPTKNQVQAILSYTAPAELGSAAIPTCYRNYIPDEMVVGEATCLSDKNKTSSVRGVHLEQICPLSNEQVPTRSASTPLDLGCGVLNLSFFVTVPKLTFEVGIK